MRHDPTQRREPDKGASPNNAPEPPHPSAPQGTDLTQGSIARHLATLAAPMMVGMIALFAFNLIDTWFVSQLGTEELAAISFTFPVVMIIGSLVMGIGVGTMSVLSRSIGASDTDRVRQLTADALLLGLGMVAVFSVVGVMTIDPVFTLLGAEGVILEHVHSYMSVWFMGMIFLVVPMIGMSVMRATGDTTTPAIIMGVAGVINALLDPLFIFGAGPIPALGLQGAAIATVISRATTLLVALYILVGRHNLVSFAAVPLRARLESWKQLMEVGLPAAASNIAVPLSGAVLTAMIASYGTHAIAAYGAASRLEMVVMLPLMAVSAGISPFAGQNWGAGRRDRVARGAQLAALFSIAYGLVAWLGLALGADLLAGLFVEDPQARQALTTVLTIIAPTLGIWGTMKIVTYSFNATGQPLKAAALNLARSPGLILILPALGSWLGGFDGLFYGVAVTNVLVGAASLIWMQSLTPPSGQEYHQGGFERVQRLQPST